MILIIGGAFQGKTDFAVERLHVPGADILDGESCNIDDVFSAVAIRNFERLVKRVMNTVNEQDFAHEICLKNPDIIIISTEIGSGIIPAEKLERQWREAVGRACCVLADFAGTVVRMNCGIPTVIKGTLL